jgi:glutathione-independent formaldehyde dehydrogenase
MYKGRTSAKPGIVFGHENLGIVEEVIYEVTDIKAGDRVIMPFNIGSGPLPKL